MIEETEDKDISENNEDLPSGKSENLEKEIQNITYVDGMFRNWWLDYASYTILERAVPHMNDGLKPVQRRILHSMWKLDDGRYNKVANIIGHTMQFHPHGDTSIGDALVGLGQRELLIDTQGNWGNILTGDSAAAPRYIEARLSKFALEVLFNPKTTEWKASYDGRNKEPVTLPVKFPLLLFQGVEGIATGLASKILPHNFNELIDASILHLQNKPFEIYPDFPTGGYADCSKYNNGARGGAVKVRAKINKIDNKTIVITEIPFGETTNSVIDSIIKANDKGKIKIKKIDDNTASEVEIVIHLHTGVNPDETIDALYVFTNCQISLSTYATVIYDNKPHFVGVDEILKNSAKLTLELLSQELNIRLAELEEEWHYASLEKIFILNELYENIKKCKTEEEILQTIQKDLLPFAKKLKRAVTHEDCVKLSIIPIKRISKFSSFKADEYLKKIVEEMEEINNHLNNIVNYTINFFRQIKKKYGKDRDRKTELRNFEVIEAQQVVVANTKLYANLKDGFIGTSLKKEEFLFDCSDIDDIIAFKSDGSYLITKVSEKAFLGKDIIHCAVFRKNDERTIYNVVYLDGESKYSYMKRFFVTGINRDKEYFVTKGAPNSKILYFSANPNGEAEKIRVFLKPRAQLRKTIFEIDFSDLTIKGRQSLGNLLTKHPVHKIRMLEAGVSTLGGRKIWFDEITVRLNIDSRGEYLGEFKGNDKILVLYSNGYYQLTSFELSNHFDDGILKIEKFNKKKIFTAVYIDKNQNQYYIKRFNIEESGKPVSFASEDDEAKLLSISDERFPQIEIIFGGKNSEREPEKIDVDEFIAIKGVKAKGKRITNFDVKKISFIEPLNKPVDDESDEEEDTNSPDLPKLPEDDPYTGNQMTLF